MKQILFPMYLPPKMLHQYLSMSGRPTLRPVALAATRFSSRLSIEPHASTNVPLHNSPSRASAQLSRSIPNINIALSRQTVPTSTGSPNIEPYTVTRTPSHQLPIYQLTKSGGNLKLTRIRKTNGDLEVLVRQLDQVLSPRPAYVKINQLTRHIVVKVGNLHDNDCCDSQMVDG